MGLRNPRSVLIDGKEVARLRKEKGWDRADLAKKSGCSPDNVDRIEAGDAVEVLPRTARYLAQALGIPVPALLASGASPPPEDGPGRGSAPAEELAVRLGVRVWSPAAPRRPGRS